MGVLFRETMNLFTPWLPEDATSVEGVLSMADRFYNPLLFNFMDPGDLVAIGLLAAGVILFALHRRIPRGSFIMNAVVWLLLFCASARGVIGLMHSSAIFEPAYLPNPLVDLIDLHGCYDVTFVSAACLGAVSFLMGLQAWRLGRAAAPARKEAL